MSDWITWILIFLSWLSMMARTHRLGDHHVQLGSGQIKIYEKLEEKSKNE